MIFLIGSLATCGLILTCIGSGLGIYNGLFHSTVTTQSFDLFIYIIGAIILLLTGFSPRRIIEPLVKPVLGLTSSNMSERGLGLKSLLLSIDYVTYYKKMLRGITAPIHKMIEYPLIILFILVGSIALISSSDYLTMFLAIELQSYGLYILVALHRNSEWSIVAGLTYFLLGGLASCFILLGSSFLYASSGVTFFDGMYIFEKMAIVCVESRLIIKVLQEKPLLLSMGLLILAVGYLFKVSAAPAVWLRKSLLRVKLSNSGDLLKLMVPSGIRKDTSGWSNYSGKVTSHKICENEMENRGSKSDFISGSADRLISVKEQRVDGSWYGDIFSYLRYTLMGFERNYQIKILPIQIKVIVLFFFSVLMGKSDRFLFRIVSLFICYSEERVRAEWIEYVLVYHRVYWGGPSGCFTIGVYGDKKNKVGWVVKLVFQIVLHKKDKALLEQIKSY
jgi:hypothetical protein